MRHFILGITLDDVKGAKNWMGEFRSLPFNEPARYAHVASWEPGRTQVPPFTRVPNEDLAARLKEMAELIEISMPLLADFLRQEKGSTTVGYLTDREGVVLAACGDPEQIRELRLEPGYVWSEKVMGANGAGSALTRQTPVAVVGTEHAFSAFDDCTCTGAPILGPERTLLGAIDVSSVTTEAKPERLKKVIALARRIERELYKRWQQKRNPPGRA